MDGEKNKELRKDGLDNLAELQNLQMRYIDVVQNLKTDRSQQDEKFADLRKKYDRLKADFLYNMQLLKERDAELSAGENVLSEYNFQIAGKDKEISDLKVKIDNLNITVGNELKAREDLQLHYQQRIREKQKELEQYRSDKDSEVTRERNELAVFKCNLERQVKELEEELDIQRRELTSDFDEAVKKREHEFRIHVDQLNNTVFSHELKIKLLTKELELSRAAHETSGQEVKQVENAQRDLEKQLKKKDWELEETKALKDAKISDLEQKLNHCEHNLKRQEEEFMRKYASFDQTMKRKDTELANARESYDGRERHLLEEVETLTGKLDDASVTIRQLKWNLEDAIKEKNNTIEKLEAEAVDIRAQWERHVAEMSRDSVSRDVHLNALRETEETLKDELSRRRQDIERYKKELADSLERASAAERANAQIELDWQRRCEEIERLSYQKSEDLVRNLTRARDEAIATLNEEKSVKERMEQLTQQLLQERDHALATLKRHGLKVDSHILVPTRDGASSLEVGNLREQNKNLQSIIKQMKEDMESLTAKPPDGMHSSSGPAFDRDYVKSLEEELSALRSKCRQLELKVSDLETFASSGVQSSDGRANDSLVHDNATVNAHFEQLNNTISALRKDKVELTAQLRKHQTVALHLQGRIDQISKQPMEKQSQIDQLQYELNASKRRNEAEVLSLRQRIADLELQVTEARKEADEYYRANVESNAELNALSNQVSQLKLELASANPAINFGAQELVIQHLEDMIARQTDQPVTNGAGPKNNNQPGGGQEAADMYKERLKMAVKDLIKIAQKNKILTEINNRQLAEMAKNGIRPTLTKLSAPRSIGLKNTPSADVESARHQRGSSDLSKAMQNKLQQLEELQYQITKQELARKGKGQAPLSNEVRGQEMNEDFQPTSILKRSTFHPGAPSHHHGRSTSRSWNSEKADSPRQLGKFPVSDSSVGGESLQDVWELIDSDGNLTPRVGKEQQNVGQHSPSSQRPRSVDSWTVTGSRPSFNQRQNGASVKQKSLSAKAAGKAKPLHKRKTVAVNYNKFLGSKESL